MMPRSREAISLWLVVLALVGLQVVAGCAPAQAPLYTSSASSSSTSRFEPGGGPDPMVNRTHTYGDRTTGLGGQPTAETPDLSTEAPSTVSGPTLHPLEHAQSTERADKSPPHTDRTSQGQIYPSLTAGQVDDNARFEEYLEYWRSSYELPVEHIDVQQRVFVRVLDGSQKPVAGAHVQLFDGQRQVFYGQTMSDGRVLFFPRAAGLAQGGQLRAVVGRGRHSTQAIVPLPADTHTTEQSVTLSDLKDNDGPVHLDLVFLLDATGSMGDEIDRIKATVDSIASRIQQVGGAKPRLGLVAYRDRGDDYVTRAWDFTDSVQAFQADLASVTADGGGDEPEAVNAGLREAINLPGWADNSTGRHLRLIVLVGDAPPHLDYPNDPRYPHLLQEAVHRGIKIFPVGASGLNPQGEYIFRQFAQVTQGKFVFLTYANGVSGEPGVRTTHHVSNYTVQDLDALIVDLVAGEVANQTGRSMQSYTVDAKPVPMATTDRGPLAWLAGVLEDLVAGAVRGNELFWLGVAVLVTLAVGLSNIRRQDTVRSGSGDEE